MVHNYAGIYTILCVKIVNEERLARLHQYARYVANVFLCALGHVSVSIDDEKVDFIAKMLALKRTTFFS